MSACAPLARGLVTRVAFQRYNVVKALSIGRQARPLPGDLPATAVGAAIEVLSSTPRRGRRCAHQDAVGRGRVGDVSE